MPTVVRRSAFEWTLPDGRTLTYAGTVPVDKETLEQAKADATARVEKAKAGQYRRFVRTDATQWVKDMKGMLGERVGQPLLELAAFDAGVEFQASEFVADAPVHESDVQVGEAKWDIKTACDAMAGVQARNDRYFAVNESQLEGYEKDGYAGLVFVRVVNEGQEADIWYVPLAEVRKADRHEPVSENVSAWFAVPIPRTLGSVLNAS